MDDVPDRPVPDARSPLERRGFDTSFVERLERAEYRRTLKVDRPAELLSAQDSKSEAESGEPSPQENRELLRQSPELDKAGTGDDSVELDQSSNIGNLARADRLVADKPAGSQNEEYAPQPPSTDALITGPEERIGPDRKHGAPRRRQILLLGSIITGIAATAAIGWSISTSLEGQLRLAREQVAALESARRTTTIELAQRNSALARTREVMAASFSEAHQRENQVAELGHRLETVEQRLAGLTNELSKTRAEMAVRAQGWSEDRTHLEADLVRLRQVVEKRDGELSLLRQHAERSAAAAQRETDALRQATDEARAKLQATSATLSLLEEQLMKQGDALSTADAQINKLTEASKGGQGSEANSLKELPARLEAMESIEEARPKGTQGGAVSTFDPRSGPLDAAQPQPIDSTALKRAWQQAPADVKQGQAAIDRLPARLELRDPDASTSPHEVIGSERAIEPNRRPNSPSSSGTTVTTPTRATR